MKHYNVLRHNEDGSMDVEESSEYDIPDDAATVNRLFTEYEATIAELRRQLREQQTRPPRYTHRNGEYEPPSVVGAYWVDSVDLSVWNLYEDENETLEWYDPDGELDTRNARYYGPIPQPITKETNP